MRLIIGLITGHCNNDRSLMSKWKEMVLDYSPAFEDEEELETIEHLLCHCRSMFRKKYRILAGPTIPCLQSLSSLDPRTLLEFFRGLKRPIIRLVETIIY